MLPNILPGILSGVALAFARAVGEIGSLVLISGNLPFHTEVASVYILDQIESGDRAGAAAVAVVLLAISFVVLLAVGGSAASPRGTSVPRQARRCAASRSATSRSSCSGRSRWSSGGRSSTGSARLADAVRPRHACTRSRSR